ncbi:polysaccharide biosynthesis tyrosine autokinase [soil metagenome]
MGLSNRDGGFMETTGTEDRRGGPGLLRAMWRYRFLVLALTLGAALVGYVVSSLRPPGYVATATLLLEAPGDASLFGFESGGDAERRLLNEIERINSGQVMRRAAKSLDQPISPEMLGERVEASSSLDQDIIAIDAAGAGALETAQMANAVARAYQDVAASSQLTQARQADILVERYIRELASPSELVDRRLLRTAAAEAVIDAQLAGAQVDTFEAAEVPSAPAEPNPLRDAAILAVLGLLVGCGLAWWLADSIREVDNGAEASRALGAPLLGVVPKKGRAAGGAPAPVKVGSPAASAYEFAIGSLGLGPPSQHRSCILVTSPNDERSSTTAALNLALAAAREGRKVLLVDADLRGRFLSRITDSDKELGFTDLGDTDVPFAACVGNFEDESLSLVSAGSDGHDPRGFLLGTEFKQAMLRIVEHADDVVVFDGPPVLTSADASAIAAQVDGTVLVVDKGTPLGLLEETRRRLDLAGTKLLGYVFNRSR